MAQPQTQTREFAFTEEDFRSYVELLESEREEDEISSLVNAITTNLTHFFREVHHFKHLADYLKKLTLKKPRGKKLRIWSAGYSIAMVALEAIPDIDTGMLARAKAGFYDADRYRTHTMNVFTLSELKSQFLEALPASMRISVHGSDSVPVVKTEEDIELF